MKILIILFLLSCYDKGIKKLSSLFKRGNTSIDNRIIYKIEKNVLLNNLYKFKANLIYIKDLNKDKLVVKDENEKTLAILENRKLILKDSNIILSASNGTIELIYNIFLYSSLELSRILEILNIKDFEKDEIGSDLLRIKFKEGHLIYDIQNKTLKEISNVMYDNGLKFENKIFFNYKQINRMLLLNKFRLESKTKDSILIAEEEIK